MSAAAHPFTRLSFLAHSHRCGTAGVGSASADAECLDEKRSQLKYNTKEEAEETGLRIAYVYEPVIRASATKNHRAFVVEDHPHHIVVTASVKKDLESAGVTGLRFQPLLSSP